MQRDLLAPVVSAVVYVEDHGLFTGIDLRPRKNPAVRPATNGRVEIVELKQSFHSTQDGHVRPPDPLLRRHANVVLVLWNADDGRSRPVASAVRQDRVPTILRSSDEKTVNKLSNNWQLGRGIKPMRFGRLVLTKCPAILNVELPSRMPNDGPSIEKKVSTEVARCWNTKWSQASQPKTSKEKKQHRQDTWNTYQENRENLEFLISNKNFVKG